MLAIASPDIVSAMAWKVDDLKQFLGGEPSVSTVEGVGRVSWFSYAGKCLRYAIVIQEDNNHVCVSADRETPFGAHSLYEFVIPCDSIQTFPDPYLQGNLALAFYSGDPTDRANLRLTIMKRPDGDLKVWPEYSGSKGRFVTGVAPKPND